MRIPFLYREPELEKQARITAEEHRLLVKAIAWKQFWFKVRLVILCALLSFVSLIALLAYISQYVPSGSRVVSEPAQRSTQSAQRYIPPSEHPFKTQRSSTSSKKLVESEKEKAYELKKGVEVVHRKDGTTYERKAVKKNE